MAVKKQDFSSICKDIIQGQFAPVYLLHGEEAYFTDQITELLLEHVLTEEEKDFNLSQFYGADVNNIGDIISTCRRYPMMAERQLVLFREIQSFDNRGQQLDNLSLYIEHPLESTIFVMVCKNKTLNGKLPKLVAEKGGVVFESKKIRDYELPKVVEPYIEEKGLKIEPKALGILCDSIGSDLSRMFHEIDKLRINLKGNKITSEDITQHIGISKEFNVWELQSAIGAKDYRKIEMIRRYFAANPKASPMVVTLSVLFGFFTNLMLAHYSPDKSVNGLMSTLKISYPQAKDMTVALKNYNAWKAMNAISIIRDYDAQCKGARNTSLSDSEALKELLFKITH